MGLLQTLLLCAALSLVQGQGVEVGWLPTLAHGVSGLLYVETENAFRIENFTYDGRGPDAFIYYYPPGIAPDITGGGIDIPFSSTRRTFEVGRRYDNEDFTFTLPEGTRMCDIGNLTIWCRYANQFFTIIEIPSDIFWFEEVRCGRTAPNSLEASLYACSCRNQAMTTNKTLANETEGLISCEPTPGTLIGQLPTLAHGVSGTFYVVNNRTLLIESFNYDGRGPDAFLYYYTPGSALDNTGGGEFIPISSSQMMFTLGRAYSDERFWFTMPDGQYACDMGYFTIWCRQANQFFTTIRLPPDIFTNNPLVADYNRSKILCNTRYTRPGVYVGELPTWAHSVSGTFYVVDNKTLFIQLFHYDGRGPDAFLYWYPAGQQPVVTGSGNIIPISATQEAFAVGRPYTNVDFTITLPENVYSCDLNYFTIWCRQANQFFTQIQIPTSIFSNDYSTAWGNDNLIYCLNEGDRPSTGAPPTSLVSYLTVALFVLAAVVFRA